MRGESFGRDENVNYRFWYYI